MSYCLNPRCPCPQNSPEDHQTASRCSTCGSKLLLQGRFSAILPIGGGGMGRTFLAMDHAQGKLKTPCVLKQFFPQSQSPITRQKATELFTQEALRLRELGSHDQIPTLLDTFEADGCLYLAQQFIEGLTLLQELDTIGPFSEAKIIALLSDLLPVLDFIHQHQVIHRDIKPENIIRRKSDQKLVLVDFGGAKYSEDLFHPKTGTLIGTIGYAPLEQIRAGKAYPSSDLYSLGMTCLHLLTQVAPNDLFDAYSGELIWESHLRRQGKTISQHLHRILSELVQDVAQDRYQSASAVIHDLQNLSTPSKVEPPSPLKIIAAVQVEAYRNQQAEFYATVSEPLKQLAGLGIAPMLHPSIQLHLTDAQPFTQPSTQFRSTIVGRVARIFSGHGATVEAIEIGPKGYILASGSADSTIRLWNLKTGQLLHRFLGHCRSIKSITMSPNGQRLVSGSLDRTILAWNLNSRQMVDRFFSHTGSPYSHRCGAIYSVAYSPDGKLIASGSADHTIKLWNQRNGELLCRLAEHSDTVLCVTFPHIPMEIDSSPIRRRNSTPQTSLFASGGADGLIKIWRFGQWHSLKTLTGHTNSVTCLAFTPDQSMIVSGSRDCTVRLWNLHTEELLKICIGHTAAVHSVAMSPDGKLLASGSSDGTIRLWSLDAHQPLGTALAVLSGSAPVMFTPDGEHLVSSDPNSSILVWELEFRK
ncbi:MAG: protein kinase [Microcoleaceae cyanobacterium]